MVTAKCQFFSNYLSRHCKCKMGVHVDCRLSFSGHINNIVARAKRRASQIPVSYTHLTLPTNREV